ncbi:hypothetical protein MHH52_16385 [Paenibacillus sp. FSL K6-0276]|uniref:hypothetical protein n=1 Tax=Paenibacillus sp. FSL K6-0276 TaxID=2921450 RepID=UPI0030EE7371
MMAAFSVMSLAARSFCSNCSFCASSSPSLLSSVGLVQPSLLTLTIGKADHSSRGMANSSEKTALVLIDLQKGITALKGAPHDTSKVIRNNGFNKEDVMKYLRNNGVIG